MKRWNLRSGILGSILGLATAAPCAHAQQPPDVVESDASGNTAAGTGALAFLTTPASRNSAFGYAALYRNTTGESNTAAGYRALSGNTTASYNTAAGSEALSNNTVGTYNTAVGAAALRDNSAGSHNTAVGSGALHANTTDSNTAIGFQAMNSTTTGANNTAFGSNSLFSNTTGKGNEAQGVNALYSNTTGIRNLAIGSNALYSNTTGSYNVSLGFDAGYNQTTGNDNIYIANQGVADESQTLRLGTRGTVGTVGSGILSAYIAGITTSQVTGSAVYVTPSGQLGVLASAERFKTSVEAMGTASEKLARLRPVTFELKTDPRGTRQYGLIAEEVAKVYPELVIHGADGRIDGVRYEELAPMLLNVLQQQHARLVAQARRAAARARIIRNLRLRATQVDARAEVIRNLERQVAQLNEFKQAMLAALGEAQPREHLVARAP